MLKLVTTVVAVAVAIAVITVGGSVLANAAQSGPAKPHAATIETSAEPKGEAAGSEKRGGDGPGGHADEPGNPNANHQFNGEE
jgi:hypothetical protein